MKKTVDKLQFLHGGNAQSRSLTKTQEDHILESGEPFFHEGMQRLYIGNGVDKISELPYEQVKNGTILIGYNATDHVGGAVSIGLNVDSDESGIAVGKDCVAAINCVSIGHNCGTTSDGDPWDYVVIGHNNTAVENGVSIGVNSVSLSDSCISIGHGSNASGANCISIGTDSIAKTDNNISIGNGSNAAGANSVVMGYNAKAFLSYTTAIGCGANAFNRNATAMGYNANASGTSATAIGNRADASGSRATAMGYNANASGVAGIAIGECSVAANDGGVSVGLVAKSSANSVSIGTGANSYGEDSVAIGHGAHSTHDCGISIGSASHSYNSHGISIGEGSVTFSQGSNGLAIGTMSSVTNPNGIAIGNESSVSGSNGIAIGSVASVSGSYNIAIGSASQTYGEKSITIGTESISYGYENIVIGKNCSTRTNGDSTYRSIIIGKDCMAYGENGVIAIGDYVNQGTVNGSNAVAIGTYITHFDGESVAIGHGAGSNAFGVALGFQAKASGNSSVALGQNATVTEENTIRLGSTALSQLSCHVGLTVTSDTRDKTDISTIPSDKSLKFINSIDPIQYVSNDRSYYPVTESTKTKKKCSYFEYDVDAHKKATNKGKRGRVGVKAQQVYKNLKDIFGSDNYANLVNDDLYDLDEVPSDRESKLTVTYGSFVPLLIGSIKELSKLVSNLQKEVDSLKEELKSRDSDVGDTQTIE